MKASVLISLLMVALRAGAVGAQAPEDRVAVDAFRDSIGSITTASRLLVIVAREKEAHPSGDREIARLRYGWSLVRLGQLSESAPPLIDASLQFYEAAVRHNDWPYAWFGLGATKLALDGIGAAEVRSAHQSAGSGWRWGAANAFLSAVRADTTYVTAAVELGLAVMRTPTWYDLPPVVAAMTRAGRSGRAGNEVWLVLGRLQRQMDQDRDALQSFDAYASLPDVDEGIAQLERARTLFALGQNAEGERAYFAGAANPSDVARALYRKDASWIQDSSDLLALDTVSAPAFPAYLAKFWHDREIASGRAAGSRLAEHYRRWEVAQRQYRQMYAINRQWDFGEIHRSERSDLDDRGVIYMRHGEPDDRAFYLGDQGVPPNESWVYHRPQGDLLLHFSASSESSGWHLIDGLGQLAISPCQVPGLLDSRATLDPSYQFMADRARSDSLRLWVAANRGDKAAAAFFASCTKWGGANSRNQRAFAIAGLSSSSVVPTYFGTHVPNEERLAATAMITTAVHTDSDPLRYRAQLQPRVQAYGVGGDRPGAGKLLLVWALPGTDKPRADTVPGVQGVVYSIRVRATIFDSLGKMVAEIDSVRRSRSPQLLGDRSILSGLYTISVPPGRYRVQLSIADAVGDKGAARVLGGIPVPAFAGALEMSDLVVGIEGGGLFWTRSGISHFPLNPRNAWTPTEAMEIGFELYGLASETPYKVRIAVADLGADSTKPPRASVEFENQATGARELVTQSLGLRALRPGVYLVSVTVTAGERSIKRERRITIVAPR